MPGIFNHKPHIIILRKRDTSGDIFRPRRIDSIDRRVPQVAYTIRRNRGINGRTRVNQRIRVSNWVFFLEQSIFPLTANVLTEVFILAGAWVTWLRDGRVQNELAMYGGVEAVPFR